MPDAGVEHAPPVVGRQASVYASTAMPALRLITCGGPFDRRTGYRDNVVVYATMG